MSFLAEQAVGDLRIEILARLPIGHEQAVSASQLAHELEISERMVGAIIADLVTEEGALVGSLCGARSGYFMCATTADLEIGVAHVIARANSMNRRVTALRRSAARLFGERSEQVRLFDLDADATPAPDWGLVNYRCGACGWTGTGRPGHEDRVHCPLCGAAGSLVRGEEVNA